MRSRRAIISFPRSTTASTGDRHPLMNVRAVLSRTAGLASVTGMLWRRHLRLALSSPRKLRQLLRQVWRLRRVSGVQALTRQFFTHGQSAAHYQRWVAAYDTLTDADRAAIRRHLERLTDTPRISLVMPTYNTPEKWLRQALESVRRQLYPHWELCIADDASTVPQVRSVLAEYRTTDPRIKVVLRAEHGDIAAAATSALALATGEFIAFLDPEEEISEHAFYMAAVELNAHPAADVIYSDEDTLDAAGRRSDPYFKPDWNPDLFLCHNLVGRFALYRTRLVTAAGAFRVGSEGRQDWDLALRVIERIPPSHIRHIPHVLYHRRALPEATAAARPEHPAATAAQQQVLISHFERLRLSVRILPAQGTNWRIQYPLPQPPPLVTLIIPTRNRCSLLQRCVASIYQKTTYGNFELLIVDNQSEDPETRRYLHGLTSERGVRVLRYDAPFNYSALINSAARDARGEVLGLLNNDLEVITPGWLEEMVSHALRPQVGAVGALLYYPNDTIQHAGVLLGVGVFGIASHAHVDRPRGDPGYRGRALLSQNLSAVTAACLVVRRELFVEVGGLDETHLPVIFNDVDLCLRLQERGYRTLWTPHAELYHHEAASRGDEETPGQQARLRAEIAYMQQRWGTLLLHDPAYNPNLSLAKGGFLLAFPPRSQKPWSVKEG